METSCRAPGLSIHQDFGVHRNCQRKRHVARQKLWPKRSDSDSSTEECLIPHPKEQGPSMSTRGLHPRQQRALRGRATPRTLSANDFQDAHQKRIRRRRVRDDAKVFSSHVVAAEIGILQRNPPFGLCQEDDFRRIRSPATRNGDRWILNRRSGSLCTTAGLHSWMVELDFEGAEAQRRQLVGHPSCKKEDCRASRSLVAARKGRWIFVLSARITTSPRHLQISWYDCIITIYRTIPRFTVSTDHLDGFT